MPLLSTTPMLEAAKKEKYGIVAFNVHPLTVSIGCSKLLQN